ncbi:MAG: sigma-70 factor domain-containing protein [Candidatus Aminicenantaceae bacterium]
MSDEFRGSLDSKNLKIYLQQISKFSQLTADQEKELGRRIQKGDKKALEKMIEISNG